jgi:hypothetical protein
MMRFAIGGVVALALLGALALRGVSEPARAAARAATSSRVEPVLRAAEPAPGFVRMPVPRATGGIRCPDGTFLPPLNGVSADDPIPPIQREPYMPQIGPILGRYTDDGGTDWWVTADGSAFTTRWQEIERGDGSRVRVVRLDQSDALEPGFARGLER